MAQIANGMDLNPALIALILGSTAAAGGFPTPSSSNSDTVGNSNSNTSGQSTSNTTNEEFLTNLAQSLSSQGGSTTQSGFSTPTLSPATQQFMDSLIGRFSGMGKIDPSTILAQQITGINKNSDAQAGLTNEILASRGLSTSPISGTAAISNENSRFAQVNQAKNNLPLLQQELDLKSLVPAANFFSSIPTGQVTGANTGFQNFSLNSSQQNQNTNSNQNSTANTANTSNTTTGQSTNTSGTAGGGPGGAFGGLASALATLFGGGKIPSINTGTTPTNTGTSPTNTGVTPGTTPGTTPPFVIGENGQKIPTTLPAGSGNSGGGFLGVLGTILGILGLGGLGVGKNGG
jgi:hypothetical protein